KAAEASISTAASVYESPKRSFRNGSSAGSAPFAKSTARWPPARAVSARRSSSCLIRPAYRRGSGLRPSTREPLALRPVPREQRVRELPVRSRDPDAVSLQCRRRGPAAAELLPLAGEHAGAVEQRLRRRMGAGALEARGCGRPQCHLALFSAYRSFLPAG